VRERLRGLVSVPFEFEFSGSQIIFLDHERDYSRYERLRDAQKIEAFREARGLGRPQPRRRASRRASS
jgi:D-glycero-alpha-D-manno-heptose-7-phosphate kinase